MSNRWRRQNAILRSRLAFVMPALVAGAWFLGTAAALAAADCPPMGHLPNYAAAEEPEREEFDGIDFTIKKDDDAETLTVLGRTCTQRYMLADGARALGDGEIQSTYRGQLGKLGAEILFAEDRSTSARIRQGGQETWIAVWSQGSEIDIVVVEKQPFKATLAAPAGNDYRLLGHMPNYVSAAPEKASSAQLGFMVQDGDDTYDVMAEGAKYAVTYTVKVGAQENSDVEIHENYRQALEALGASILYTEPRTTVAILDSGGQTIWISVHSQESRIDIGVIEEKSYQLGARPPSVESLKTALAKEGRATLYVDFDFNKATLKPEARPVLAPVVKLLQADPALHLTIEGHTDDIGQQDFNLKLSEDRAAAVADALVAAGIPRERLSTEGFGPNKPIGDNGTTEGRARNRRIELVRGG
jgi:outer membrane protein OmpA-like peptidoglycan-associated protein